MAELQSLGLRSVPVLARGKHHTFGQSTKQIVDFLGLQEKSGPRLPVGELISHLDKFMGAALELLPLMPADRLEVHVPGRPRSYRSLGFHLFRVVDAFLDATRGETLVQAMFRDEPAPDASLDDLTDYGSLVRERFGDWRRDGDTSPAMALQTYYGQQSQHELLERTTWHCGQHVRQWMMLLEREGVEHSRPLRDADFAGLPMPQNVWDG